MADRRPTSENGPRPPSAENTRSPRCPLVQLNHTATRAHPLCAACRSSDRILTHDKQRDLYCAPAQPEYTTLHMRLTDHASRCQPRRLTINHGSPATTSRSHSGQMRVHFEPDQGRRDLPVSLDWNPDPPRPHAPPPAARPPSSRGNRDRLCRHHIAHPLKER